MILNDDYVVRVARKDENGIVVETVAPGRRGKRRRRASRPSASYTLRGEYTFSGAAEADAVWAYFAQKAKELLLPPRDGTLKH